MRSFSLSFFCPRKATNEIKEPKTKKRQDGPSSPSTAIAFCFMYSVRKAPMLSLREASDSEGSVESVFRVLSFEMLLERLKKVEG